MSSRGRNRVVDLRRKKSASGASARTAPILFPERRKSSLRSRRRKMRAFAVALLIILFAAAVKGASYASYLPEYAVNDVSVVGANDISPKVLRAYAETQINDGTSPFISRQNIFLYPRVKMEQGMVNRFPRIFSANISRESLLAQAITVTVTERQQSALWCSDGRAGNGQEAISTGKETPGKECFEMDNGG